MKIELDSALKGYQRVALDGEIVCDWKAVSAGTGTIPLEDDVVDEVYASHFIQRHSPFRPILWEIARVCRVGAVVELRVPHFLHSMALAEGQRIVFSEHQVRHLTRDFIPQNWPHAKRFELTRTDRVRGDSFKEAQGIFPHLTDDQILRFIPDCCHEVGFIFQVVRQ